MDPTWPAVFEGRSVDSLATSDDHGLFGPHDVPPPLDTLDGMPIEPWAPLLGKTFQEGMAPWKLPPPIISDEGDDQRGANTSQNQGEITGNFTLLLEPSQKYGQHEFLFVNSGGSNGKNVHKLERPSRMLPIRPLSFLELVMQTAVNSYPNNLRLQRLPNEASPSHPSFKIANYPSERDDARYFYLETLNEQDREFSYIEVEPHPILHLVREIYNTDTEKDRYDKETPLIRGPSVITANTAMMCFLDTYYPGGVTLSSLGTPFHQMHVPVVKADLAIGALCDFPDVWQMNLATGTKIGFVLYYEPAYSATTFDYGDPYFCLNNPEVHGPEHDKFRNNQPFYESLKENTYLAHLSVAPFACPGIDNPLEWGSRGEFRNGEFNKVFRPQRGMPVAYVMIGTIAAMNAVHHSKITSSYPYNPCFTRKHYGVPIPSVVPANNMPGHILSSSMVLGKHAAGTLPMLRVNVSAMKWKFIPGEL